MFSEYLARLNSSPSLIVRLGFMDVSLGASDMRNTQLLFVFGKDGSGDLISIT